MVVWRRLAGNFPRIAVMLHDLVMVWACWQLLHVARYAMLAGAPAIPLFSESTGRILVEVEAQNAVQIQALAERTATQIKIQRAVEGLSITPKLALIDGRLIRRRRP